MFLPEGWFSTTMRLVGGLPLELFGGVMSVASLALLGIFLLDAGGHFARARIAPESTTAQRGAAGLSRTPHAPQNIHK